MVEKKTRYRTDFEADRWPETGDFFGLYNDQLKKIKKIK